MIIIMEHFIMTATDVILDKCKKDIDNKFNELSAELVNSLTRSVKMEITDKIYGDGIKLDYEKYNNLYNLFDTSQISVSFVDIGCKYEPSVRWRNGNPPPGPPSLSWGYSWASSVISEIKNKYQLRQSENVIYFNTSITSYTLKSCPDSLFYNIYVNIVTDLSTTIHAFGGATIRQHQTHPQFGNSNIDIRTESTYLHAPFIKLLQDILASNSSAPSIKPMIDTIIKYNEMFYIKFLTNYDVQTKNESLLKQLTESQRRYDEQQTEINKLTELLKNSIPVEYQCCICFGFTLKREIISPCGHTQYCHNCITKIETCALCKGKVEKIITIY